MTVAPLRENSLLRRFSVFVLAAAVADFLFGAVFVTVLLERGVDPWLLGSVLAAAHLVGLVVEAPSGALGDRYGHRRLMVVGLALWGAGFAAFGLADALATTALGLGLWAVGYHLYSGTPTALVVNRIGSRDRAARIARTVRYGQVAGRSGAVLGAASVMVAGAWLPADLLVAAGGGLLVLLAALGPVCFPPSPGQPGRRVLAIVAESASLVAGVRFLPLVALTASMAVGTALLVVSWQPMLVAAHGDDVRLNGLMLLVMTAALTAGALCAKFLDLRDPRLWGPACATLVGAPVALAAHGAVPLWAGLVAGEFLIGLAGVLMGVWQQTMFTDANRNTMFSMLAMVAGALVMATTLSFGWLWELFGLPRATTALASVGVLLAVASAVLARIVPAPARPAEGARPAERAEPSPEADSPHG
ncbi:MFS transporter [Nocardiopsis tropica]|uniref:MFS transporter n=1 Tax=Nocardiopsis tropica TaxID=109330 RepID=A0ABU7KLU8_9ACTN|nr:MFS transporter [Nocardiopsis umidischolae]MEE2049979.1 MFS transporter [Nocardiopsis umidischolae]